MSDEDFFDRIHDGLPSVPVPFIEGAASEKPVDDSVNDLEKTDD